MTLNITPAKGAFVQLASNAPHLCAGVGYAYCGILSPAKRELDLHNNADSALPEGKILLPSTSCAVGEIHTVLALTC